MNSSWCNSYRRMNDLLLYDTFLTSYKEKKNGLEYNGTSWKIYSFFRGNSCLITTYSVTFGGLHAYHQSKVYKVLI